jgi:hypothetical protein
MDFQSRQSGRLGKAETSVTFFVAWRARWRLHCS